MKCNKCGTTSGVSFYGLTGLALCKSCYNAIVGNALRERWPTRSPETP